MKHHPRIIHCRPDATPPEELTPIAQIGEFLIVGGQGKSLGLTNQQEIANAGRADPRFRALPADQLAILRCYFPGLFEE